MDALQRRVVVEDTVQYKLFLAPPDGSNVTEKHLTYLAEEILAKFAPLLVQYIWQNQPFNLKYHSEKGMNASLDKLLYSWYIYLAKLNECLCWQEAFLLTLEVALSLEKM